MPEARQIRRLTETKRLSKSAWRTREVANSAISLNPRRFSYSFLDNYRIFQIHAAVPGRPPGTIYIQSEYRVAVAESLRNGTAQLGRIMSRGGEQQYQIAGSVTAVLFQGIRNRLLPGGPSFGIIAESDTYAHLKKPVIN